MLEVELAHESVWEIENPEIAELDERRNDLNRESSRLWNQFVEDPRPVISLTTVNKVGQKSRDLKRDLRKSRVKDLNLFDSLVHTDMERNVKIVRAFHSYLYNWEEKVMFKDFLNRTYGGGTYGRFIEGLKPENFPHEALDRYDDLTHDMRMRSMDSEVALWSSRNPAFTKLGEGLLERLQGNRNFVNRFFSDVGCIKGIGEYNLEFSPPGYDFSFWQGQDLLMSIDPEAIIFYRVENAEYAFFDAQIKTIGAHELGHGLHEILSEKTMPLGLRPGAESLFILAHGPNLEGVALATEEPCMRYMEENRENLGLTSFDLEVSNLAIKTYLAQKGQKIFDKIGEMEEFEQKIAGNPCPPDFETIMAKLTGIKAYMKDRYIVGPQALHETLPQFSYLVGSKTVGGIVERMKGEGHGYDVIFPAIFSGVWCSPEAQERFIFDHYLPRVTGADAHS